ncbi:hypothetical protein NADFUDRAFT_50817 [Nadsonia fulvescens var. elongata DSM 6958]|uniref:Membrane magnesium transporter n=1 Tax=Nadsonia fulvescens var. elongata DSM 6958 TaxID=857566 RepID=A0A1E3PK04_9ASCO|nr:hypothetical protein NADFUDRAFT_50817 [Nadsonia fulvescens var. elongata DSM 6958]
MYLVGSIELIISLLLLLHSGYSVYEFSHFIKYLSNRSGDISLFEKKGIPLDIKIEVIIAVLLSCIGATLLTLGRLTSIKFADAIVQKEKSGNGPYVFLERRPAFANLVEKRNEVMKWKQNLQEKKTT